MLDLLAMKPLYLFGFPLHKEKAPNCKIEELPPGLEGLENICRMMSAFPPAYAFALQQRAFLNFVRNSKQTKTN